LFSIADLLTIISRKYSGEVEIVDLSYPDSATGWKEGWNFAHK